tara:strand:- start:138 stop:590 length:453 start_codon:yes stop_codon:yes gene_type:complete
MKKLIFFVVLFSACSAQYHLKRALKKDPRLGDSITKLIPYYKDTNIVINIIGDTSDQNVKFKQWYKQATDSMTTAFNDSFVQVNQTIDSLGNLKTKVIRKPYTITTQVIIHDTVEIKIPPAITVKNGVEIKWYIWLLFAIFVAAICIRKL